MPCALEPYRLRELGHCYAKVCVPHTRGWLRQPILELLYDQLMTDRGRSCAERGAVY